MGKQVNPDAAGYLLESAACKKILKELERLAEKYKRKIDREQAARKAEFEAVMQYSSEKDILDAYGWEFITENSMTVTWNCFERARTLWNTMRPLVQRSPTTSSAAWPLLFKEIFRNGSSVR